jgi:zinc-binding alcohol dehydrogenase family protein
MGNYKIKVVGYFQNLAISEKNSLVDLEIEKPKLTLLHDILVRVKAISVNPVDFKIRQGIFPKGDQPKILGWDAAGIVEDIGTAVSEFKIGDEVYYAGDISRSGTNGEFHLVDSRIVGKKPKSLDFEKAAALPLTAITAWEIIFDRLNISKNEGGSSILVMAGAGGVGSISIQLLKKLTSLKIIGTASRSESIEWVQSQGADAVINHKEPMSAQIEKLKLPPIKYIISTASSDTYAQQFADIIMPQGHVALIDDPQTFDIVPFKRKSVSIHWELIFTKSLFQTDDMIEQGKLLNEVSQLIDQNILHTTQKLSLGKLNAENLKKAHEILESGASLGKITLSV